MITEDVLSEAFEEYHKIYSENVRSYRYDIASREALRAAIERAMTLYYQAGRDTVGNDLNKVCAQ
jgi:hypothetical protein